MKRHVNIPIFIPHLGCPNQCVFCNQRTITGVDSFEPSSVKGVIDNALSTVGEDVEAEIAFFGGSFTGIDYSLMCELLRVAYCYVLDGRVSSIRCSTRPDYINEKILETLKRYGVRTIELGLQSSDDYVLSVAKRGHSFEDEKKAARLICGYGFRLVGQMMIGLPGSSEESELRTAEFIAECGAAAARIYPTVVFYGTELCDMAKSGIYKPLTDEEAVKRSEKVFRFFLERGIEVIRIGLCASENLSGASSYYAGPNHSALGELVENEHYYNEIKEKIINIKNSNKTCGSIVVSVAKGALSKAIGQHKRNKLRLAAELRVSLRFTESKELSGYEISVAEEERKNKCT